MIQRIQTVFLFLAAACFGFLIKLPFATSDLATSGVLSDKEFSTMDHPALMILTLAGAALALVIIFLYKNRKLQAKLVFLIIVLAISLVLIAYLLVSKETSTHAPPVEFTTQAGLFLPLGAVIFGIIAGYFIRKDEKLVKSMDRLR